MKPVPETVSPRAPDPAFREPVGQVLPVIGERRILTDTGIFTVEELDLTFANGATRRYQRILGGDLPSVLIVPWLGEELVLIHEYSSGSNRYELTFPKGRVDPGEITLEAANRELREECGFAARQLRDIAALSLAPAYIQHQTRVVIAEELYPSPLMGDEPEPLEVQTWPLTRLDALLADPRFTEGRCVAALWLALRQRPSFSMRQCHA